ncbi:hypothetical protein GXM_05518 [Nostoc sphaeroides CCNUC1]|uniref:Uncharacterized protein n=1 Tax=Nostoc sphaeroides CCNUC1 TaxID=2653204 RepID=A0A5P8W700_9NOSO|nr:hypothetical protein GXM_05518 [Nostoc sphaeroides CCNUC1]
MPKGFAGNSCVSWHNLGYWVIGHWSLVISHWSLAKDKGQRTKDK